MKNKNPLIVLLLIFLLGIFLRVYTIGDENFWLDENQNIELNDDYIWLTLGQIKKLMLYDNIVNPFVKTILSPL
mgnify:CR=1 FL=1